MPSNVLVPVDGSSQSRKAFEFALDQHPDAALTLIHVINPTSAFGYADDEYFDVEAFEREEARRREAAEALMDELREAAEAAGVTVSTVVRVGAPAKRILELAEEREVDHVVMGSRGRSGFGRVLFGSVAETVARRAPAPVTIVR